MEFKAVIKLDNSSDKELLNKNVKYAGCKNNFDVILIKENEIIISGARTNNKLSSAYEITHSTLYEHFINSLLYLYFSQRKLFAIKSISVNNYLIDEYQINQLFTKNISIQYDINSEVLELCLDNKHKILQNTLLYLLQAISAEDNKRMFERLWMAFNCLYSFDKNESSEQNKLNYIKNNCITKNKKFFNLSLKITDELMNEEIISNFRWQKYLSNKLRFQLQYNNKKKVTEKKTESDIYESFYRDIIQAYNDYRILNCFNNRLKNKAFYTHKDGNVLVSSETLDKLQTKTQRNNTSKKTKQVECLKSLAIDYAYFLRCTFFHGAVNDAYYELLKIDSFDDELKIINEALYALIIDLLNSKLIPC